VFKISLPYTIFFIQLRTPFNWLLMNLSLTELIIAFSGNSILAFNSFNRKWSLSAGACQANAFGMTYLGGPYYQYPIICKSTCNFCFAGIQSIVTLSVLALQRYMMVTKDRQFPLSTPLSTLFTLIFIWTYSFLVSFPPLMGFGTFGQNTLGVR
jgi:c-opsin